MLAGPPPYVQQNSSSPVATIITPSSLTSSLLSVVPLMKDPLTISTEMKLPQIPAVLSPTTLSTPEKEMARLTAPSQNLVSALQDDDTNDENATPQSVPIDRFTL